MQKIATVPHCKEPIPKKGIARPQSQFPQSCVCERFIYSHHRSAYSAAGNMWPNPGKIWTIHRHMNVEIRTEAAQFPSKEYKNGIFVAMHCANMYYMRDRLTDPKPWNLKLSEHDPLFCHSASKKLHNFLVDIFTHIFWILSLWCFAGSCINNAF